MSENAEPSKEIIPVKSDVELASMKDVPALAAQMDENHKKTSVILAYIENANSEPSSLVTELNNKGIVVTEGEVVEILKSEFSIYGDYGKNIQLIGKDRAYSHFREMLNNIGMAYSKLYDAFEVALFQFEQGEVGADDVVAISKELRLREEAMAKLVNGIYEAEGKAAQGGPLVQVNTFNVDDLRDKISQVRERSNVIDAESKEVTESSEAEK